MAAGSAFGQKGHVCMAAGSVFSLEGWYVWPQGRLFGQKGRVRMVASVDAASSAGMFGRRGRPQTGGLVCMAALVGRSL